MTLLQLQFKRAIIFQFFQTAGKRDCESIKEALISCHRQRDRA